MEKHLMITGTSTVSWKDAIVRTIAEASKTIDYLSGVTILNQKAKINGSKITEYYVDLDITFLHGNIINFTFELSTILTASISCLKLYSKLSLYSIVSLISYPYHVTAV